jgi:hypothetical protein
MPVVKLRAFSALAAAIEAAVPALAGKVIASQAAPERIQDYPTLVIHPVRFRYEPDQAEEKHVPRPDQVVMDVGRHLVTVQLRISAATSAERYALQEAVDEFFLSTPLQPGSIYTEVTSVPALGAWRATWDLDEDSWEDERAFEQVFGGTTVIAGNIPALVTRGDTYRIDHLLLGLTEELARPVDSNNFLSADFVEVVELGQDGGISPP